MVLSFLPAQNLIKMASAAANLDHRDPVISDSDSDESDDELQPYQFEPSASEGESSSWATDSDGSDDGGSVSDEQYGRKSLRKDAEEWCQCTNCQQQEYQINRVCVLQGTARCSISCEED